MSSARLSVLPRAAEPAGAPGYSLAHMVGRMLQWHIDAARAGVATGNGVAGTRGLDLTARGYAYANAYHFVLQHGIYFPVSVSANVPRLATRSWCFRAIYRHAAENGLGYAEGFAHTGFPFHHAWCVDHDGCAVDMTLVRPARAYLGVVLPMELAAAHFAASDPDVSLLEDWENGWPLLRHAFRV